LRSARGPLVMEVNASPGIEGIEHCTGIDLATLMIEYVEQQVGILQGCAARLHSDIY
ncbi:MAG: hypothetical protein ACRC0Z_03000, partial [Plesiomonas sp.]